MDEIGKSTKETSACLSCVYVSLEQPASFSGLDKLYRIAKKEFPSITRNEIKQWAETNLPCSLHKPSGRNFKCNKYMLQKSKVHGKLTWHLFKM